MSLPPPRRIDSSAKALGEAAEKAAGKYLESKGYKIIDQNVRLSIGEIDLVARKDEQWVLVEVKGGMSDPDFSPVDHFDIKKRRKLLSLARLYSTRLPEGTDLRIDLISIVQKEGRWMVDHFEDVLQDSGA